MHRDGSGDVGFEGRFMPHFSDAWTMKPHTLLIFIIILTLSLSHIKNPHFAFENFSFYDPSSTKTVNILKLAHCQSRFGSVTCKIGGITE